MEKVNICAADQSWHLIIWFYLRNRKLFTCTSTLNDAIYQKRWVFKFIILMCGGVCAFPYQCGSDRSANWLFSTTLYLLVVSKRCHFTQSFPFRKKNRDDFLCLFELCAYYYSIVRTWENSFQNHKYVNVYTAQNVVKVKRFTGKRFL